MEQRRTSNCGAALPGRVRQLPQQHPGAGAKLWAQWCRGRGQCPHRIHELPPDQPGAGRAASDAAPSVRTPLCAGVPEQWFCFHRGAAPQINEGETAAPGVPTRHLGSAKAALAVSNAASSWKTFLLLQPFGSPCSPQRSAPYGTAGSVWIQGPVQRQGEVS